MFADKSRHGGESTHTDQLITGLDTDDPREQRRLGELLLDAGNAAVPSLVETLSSGPPNARKAAAYLLGRLSASAQVVEVLASALIDDPEPKVRRNAAVSLGRLAAPEGLAPLAAAITDERVDWVRTSTILALGAIGGDESRAALRQVTPSSDAEEVALAKALDRLSAHRPTVSWRTGIAWQYPIWLDVPEGLETTSVAEAEEHGIGGVRQAGPGLLRCPTGVAPWDLLPRLRCAYGLRILAGEGPPLPTQPGEMAAAVADWIAASPPLSEWRSWLETAEPPLRYRFSMDHTGATRETRKTVLQAVRGTCQPLGLADSPSNYSIELTVSSDDTVSRIWIKPSFQVDDRFVYRVRDVGAAINPAVAACLSRLVFTSDGATVLDPTCGSATLLIERAMLGDGGLIGLDISRAAVAAARTNVHAAGLHERIRIVRANAQDGERWPECDEIMANLPFGSRTRETGTELATLYRAIVSNVAARLRPGGRAVLYTSRRALMRSALTAGSSRLAVSTTHRVRSGGMWVHVWVVTASER